ncbi:hypothetical protein M426DRAFT_23929 [Hypoxylon sp. CI-4A]|nr:hypothetical protein M426DRAFT_23929 [Hypoxylon sp. CI-4A]
MDDIRDLHPTGVLEEEKLPYGLAYFLQHPCWKAMEQLFGFLPKPEAGEKSDRWESSIMGYREALQVFLKIHGAAPGEHDKTCQAVSAAANEVLSPYKRESPRHAFINNLEYTFMRISDQDFYEYPTTLPFMGHYFQFCKWIMQGRKDETNQDYPLLPMDQISDPNDKPPFCPAEGVIRRDFSQLPRALTTPSCCAHCNRPGPKSRCQRCAVQYGSHTTTIGTAYCNRECQQLDWQKHKPICADRQRIRRVTKLIVSIFKIMEEECTVRSFDHSHERNNIIVLDEESRHLDALQGKSALIPLKIYKDMPKAHQDAALAEMYAADVSLAGGNYEFKKWLLENLYENVQEVVVKVKNVHRPIVCHTTHNGTESNVLLEHLVYRITTPQSGECFALDLSGGRYGWVEPLMHWEHFEKERLYHVIAERKLAKTAHLRTAYEEMCLPTTLKYLVHSNILDIITKRAQEYLTSPDWMHMPDATSFLDTTNVSLYDTAEGGILEIARKASQMRLRGVTDSVLGGYRLFPNARLEDWVECRPSDMDRMSVPLTKMGEVSRQLRMGAQTPKEELLLVWQDICRQCNIQFEDRGPTMGAMENAGASLFKN